MFSSEEGSDRQVILIVVEQRVLQCLDATIISQWVEFLTPRWQAFFENAASSGDRRFLSETRERIAGFLHIRNNETPGSVYRGLNYELVPQLSRSMLFRNSS